MNLGVHNDAVDPHTFKRTLRVLEQSDADPPLTKFFLDEVDVFKGSKACTVV